MRRSPKTSDARRSPDEGRWSLLTTHALVLLCIARNPETRVREIAAAVGISERGAHQIVADLVLARYVQRTRVGRRNRYAIEEKTPLKHGPVKHRRVASIVALLEPEPAERPTKVRGAREASARSSRSRASSTELTRSRSDARSRTRARAA
jgi:DNA-binding MarR family transcriptional regulator